MTIPTNSNSSIPTPTHSSTWSHIQSHSHTQLQQASKRTLVWLGLRGYLPKSLITWVIKQLGLSEA